MPETPDLYYEIKKIQAKIDNIDNKLSLSLASNKEAISFIESIFKKSKALSKAYLNVDGKSNVSLLAEKIGKKQSNVTNYLKRLHEIGLIDKSIQNGEVIYQKNQYEKIFRISDIILKNDK
ncbi:MAG: hypothetical protein GF353_04685 [Candidatus Lokiarchaeota archaeon]|nr:hypothetical protein [Candidatus Lokiarchaeota archaeon]